jgi:hypothetical protein
MRKGAEEVTNRQRGPRAKVMVQDQPPRSSKVLIGAIGRFDSSLRRRCNEELPIVVWTDAYLPNNRSRPKPRFLDCRAPRPGGVCRFTLGRLTFDGTMNVSKQAGRQAPTKTLRSNTETFFSSSTRPPQRNVVSTPNRSRPADGAAKKPPLILAGSVSPPAPRGCGAR